MLLPKPLQPGDTVAIVATARKIDEEELTAAVALLESWGLKVLIGNSIGLQNRQFAGTDSERFADFQTMLYNPTVKGIWCARGGYGTVRIIDILNFSDFSNHPKWIVGYSDITVLHSHLNTLRIASMHATMPVNISRNSAASLASLKTALFGQKNVYDFPHESKKLDTITGELVGGNLSILYSLLGSSSSIDTRGKILFLEDLDEYLYHVDRMMMNLKRNGYFDEIKALLVGGMTKMKDNSIPFGKTAREIIEDVCKNFDFPIIFDVPAGHIQDNRTLIIGKEITIKIGYDKVQLIQ